MAYDIHIQHTLQNHVDRETYNMRKRFHKSTLLRSPTLELSEQSERERIAIAANSKTWHTYFVNSRGLNPELEVFQS